MLGTQQDEKCYQAITFSITSFKHILCEIATCFLLLCCVCCIYLKWNEFYVQTSGTCLNLHDKSNNLNITLFGLRAKV